MATLGDADDGVEEDDEEDNVDESNPWDEPIGLHNITVLYTPFPRDSITSYLPPIMSPNLNPIQK